jgi:integrase
MQALAKQPRRVRVERGIYKRQTPKGVRYELTYTDSTGRQRWQTVRGGLKEARRARAEIVSKLGRGERVAPTRATLAEVAVAWLDAQTQLRPRTKERYGSNIRLHIVPKQGRLRIGEVNTDDVARVIADMQEAGYAAWTIRGVLTVLGRVLGSATRRGLIPDNPVRRLERGERPKVERREMRILDRDGISRVLDLCQPKYRALLATAIFTGLRQGEQLALTWADMDFGAGVLHVRYQLDRGGQRVAPKTPQALREVILMPTLATVLKTHKEKAFGRGFARPSDPVFASEVGTPMNYRNIVKRGLDPALEAAKVAPLRWHDLRHTFASLLVAEGANVVFVARQLGHVSTKETLDTYAKLFDRIEHAERTREALEASFGSLLGEPQSA